MCTSIYSQTARQSFPSLVRLHASLRHSAHSLSLSQSISPSEPLLCESLSRAMSYLSGDNAKTIHAGQTKKGCQPMLKFIPTNIITGGKKKEEDGDTSVKKRGGIIKSGKGFWRRRRGGGEEETPHTLARERSHSGQMLLHVGLLWGLGCLLHSAEGNQDS